MAIVTGSQHMRNSKVCVLAGIILVLTYPSFIYHLKENTKTKPLHYIQKADFKVTTLMNGVHTFSNVCLELLDTPKSQNIHGFIYNETKKIVVYGNTSRADGEIFQMGVAGSINTQWNHWQIHFRRQDLPDDYRKNLKDTAFFAVPTCPGNFHHFFVDEFVPLYSVVVLSNRLHPGANNHILYRTPEIGKIGNRCHCRRTYEGFLKTLHINDFHDVFYNFPNRICFRHAVFGNTPLLFRQRDVIDHVLRSYQLPLKSNGNQSDLFVTIQTREDRRIINVDEVINFAKDVGFRNVRTVNFQNKSIHDQLQIMATSNVFIGIQGAGLQWAAFMPESSFLIEIAWPQKHWGFYYNKFIPRYGITWNGVGVQDVRLNWTSYAINVRSGVPVNDSEKATLIKNHPRNNADNIWKWADIVVQKQEILGTLEIVKKGLHIFR